MRKSAPGATLTAPQCPGKCQAPSRGQRRCEADRGLPFGDTQGQGSTYLSVSSLCTFHQCPVGRGHRLSTCRVRLGDAVSRRSEPTAGTVHRLGGPEPAPRPRPFQGGRLHLPDCAEGSAVSTGHHWRSGPRLLPCGQDLHLFCFSKYNQLAPGAQSPACSSPLPPHSSLCSPQNPIYSLGLLFLFLFLLLVLLT